MPAPIAPIAFAVARALQMLTQATKRNVRTIRKGESKDKDSHADVYEDVAGQIFDEIQTAMDPGLLEQGQMPNPDIARILESSAAPGDIAGGLEQYIHRETFDVIAREAEEAEMMRKQISDALEEHYGRDSMRTLDSDIDTKRAEQERKDKQRRRLRGRKVVPINVLRDLFGE